MAYIWQSSFFSCSCFLEDLEGVMFSGFFIEKQKKSKKKQGKTCGSEKRL